MIVAALARRFGELALALTADGGRYGCARPFPEAYFLAVDPAEVTVVAPNEAEPKADTCGALVAQILASLDPEMQQAVAEVDRSLIRLSLAQSPRDRLRSASNMMRSLVRFGRVPSSAGR